MYSPKNKQQRTGPPCCLALARLDCRPGGPRRQMLQEGVEQMPLARKGGRALLELIICMASEFLVTLLLFGLFCLIS